MRALVVSFVFSKFAFALAMQAQDIQPAETDRLQIERVVARHFATSNIGKEMQQAGARLAAIYYHDPRLPRTTPPTEPGNLWGARHPAAHAANIAADMALSLANEDTLVVTCSGPQVSRAPCGLTGSTTLVAISPAIQESGPATVQIAVWNWQPPAQRGTDRSPDRPHFYLYYELIRDPTRGWTVQRVRSGIR